MAEGLQAFWGGFADMDQTCGTIGAMYHEEGYLLDTHTAVAYKVYQDYRAQTGDSTPAVIAATASAYKFSDSVADAIGIGKGTDGFDSVRKLQAETGVPVPSGLAGLEDKPVRHKQVVDADDMLVAIADTEGLNALADLARG